MPVSSSKTQIQFNKERKSRSDPKQGVGFTIICHDLLSVEEEVLKLNGNTMEKNTFCIYLSQRKHIFTVKCT